MQRLNGLKTRCSRVQQWLHIHLVNAMPKPRIGLKHQLLKSRARASASSVLANALLIPVAFKPIDSQALEALNDWGDDVHFSWEEVPNWKAKEPWSFDVSIWCGPQLCGLCFANPNQSRLRTRIVRLEGKPDSRHPLKNRIAALAMFAVEQYARQVGSQWLEIQEPAPGAMKSTRSSGFNLMRLAALLSL